jgi:Na+/proline symporter/signal transduction histidine kinase/CheY-like chemotaxis protein
VVLQGWVIIILALAYIGFLFLVASYGDRRRERARSAASRLLIYPLSLAIYCTSWTFFGSVGLASRTGYEFLTIYIGPMLMVGLAYPLLIRIVRLAKVQNITSIADLIAARYGKSQAVAATVALIAIVGMVPYIALQLKAVSSSVGTILAEVSPGQPMVGDSALFVALLMAAFAVLFGTRHTDATEHQDGLMLAIATESIVKLVAFLAVGIFVTFVMFHGPFNLFVRALDNTTTAAVLTRVPPLASFCAMTTLSLFAIVLLPRQFHVAIVENHSESEIRRAAWLFPAYLVLINLFVVPIAMAGLLTFPAGHVDGDMFVLALPLAAHSELVTLIAFVGGLSAATAMVIVESVALAIMVSNDIVVPLVLKRKGTLSGEPSDAGAWLLTTRRIAIFVILLLAYIYYRSAGDAQLAAIGLLSFAAVAQLAPAFFGGLVWQRGTARGAIAGMTAGIVVWGYTLLLPSISDAGIVGVRILTDGPWGLDYLRPQGLFGLDLPPLVHGVLLSLVVNVAFYVAFSFGRRPTAIERVQADVFVPSALAPILAPRAPSFRLRRASVTVEELIATVARYLGEERTRESFISFAASRRISLEPAAEADFEVLQYGEYLLASAIGAASSRLVLSLLLRKRTVSTKDALKLLDDASAAIHYNREILQTALDHVRQGIAVFDKDLNLVCWNRQFGEILDLPHDLTRVGSALDEILRYVAQHNSQDQKDFDAAIAERLAKYTSEVEPFLERIAERSLVIEVRANRMPDGGLVTTFTDITPSVKAAEALERANATLERRVRERTRELTRLNTELEQAKAEADDANVSKTRFVAAASHDILQPLNAARLYVTSLIERQRAGEDASLVQNIDASLEAVEEIFAALLDISRLDTGAMKPEMSDFRIDELLQRLDVEFAPLAREKGLKLRFMPCSLTVRSDRRLLRRLLQNFVSNAIKYTPSGCVLVGCRRRGDKLRIDVYDTGIGIPHSKRRAVFKEFHRLDQGARVARGVGLGLSIVERVARVLECEVALKSVVGRGSRFSVEAPLGTAAAAATAARAVARPHAGRLNGTIALCIDNDRSILDGMEKLLGGWGCRVLTAADLTEALAAIDASGLEPDGLLVDYHLDGGNGIGAIAELRRRLGRQLGRDLPAILITADRSAHVRDEAQAEGVHLLHKPIKPASLRAIIMQWRVQWVAAE